MRKLRDLIRRYLTCPTGRRALAGAAGAAVLLFALGSAHAVEREAVWAAFKKNDTNESAALEKNELMPVLHALHEHVEEGELDRVFAEIDHDQNGAIDFEELFHYAERPNFWTWSNHKPPTGWFWIDFILFLMILVYYTRKPIQAMFQNRHETIKKQLGDAAQAHETALAHREEYRDKLARVDEEAKLLVSGAREDGAAIRERIIEASKKYAERLRTDATAAVTQEEQLARRRLRQEVAFEVLREAGTLIEKEISADDQQRLIEQTIKDIEAGAGDVAGALEAAGGAP